MALRLEKAFGVSMDTLMRMQNSYDIAKARKGAKGIKVQRFRRAALGAHQLITSVIPAKAGIRVVERIESLALNSLQLLRGLYVQCN